MPSALVEFGMRQNGHVQQILQSRLEVAVEIGVFQHPLGFLASDIEVALQDDAVLGQRAGLVGAQDVHRAKILNRVEAFDDDLLRDMAIAPLARLTVTIIGSISGVSPTATATANNSASSQSSLVSPLIRKTAGTITRMKRIISQVKLLMPLVEAGRHALAGDLVGELAEEGFRAGLHDHAGAVAATRRCRP